MRILSLLFLATAETEAPPSTPVKVHCSTTQGEFTLAVHPNWSPQGAARFLDLVKAGYYTDIAFYRVVPKWIVQFGVASTPALTKNFRTQGLLRPIPDDPPRPSGGKDFTPITRGMVSFAGSGANSRQTQIFFAIGEKTGLGKSKWETPFGIITQGAEFLDKLHSYGDIPPFGKGSVGRGRAGVPAFFTLRN